MLIATELERIGSSAKELYGLRTSSLIWRVLYSIKDNNTFSLPNHGNAENGQHGWSEFRNTAEHKERERKAQETREGEKSKSTIRIERNDDLRRKHSRHPKPRYAQTARYK